MKLANGVRFTEHTLWFTPFSWSKAMYWKLLADEKGCEMGWYGHTTLEEKLRIIDIWMPTQKANGGRVTFENLSDDTEIFIRRGYSMEQVMRIWGHTHPGMPSVPSGIDEKQWEKPEHATQDWSVMCILGDKGDYYARLRVRTAFGYTEVEIPVCIDWVNSFDGVTDENLKTWKNEFEKVHSKVPASKYRSGNYYDNESECWRPHGSHTVYVNGKPVGEVDEGKECSEKRMEAQGLQEITETDEDEDENNPVESFFNGLSDGEKDEHKRNVVEQDDWEEQDDLEEQVELADALGITVKEVETYGLDWCRDRYFELENQYDHRSVSGNYQQEIEALRQQFNPRDEDFAAGLDF